MRRAITATDVVHKVGHTASKWSLLEIYRGRWNVGKGHTKYEKKLCRHLADETY